MQTSQTDIEVIDLLMEIYLQQIIRTNYAKETQSTSGLLQKIGSLNIYQGRLETAIAIFQNILVEDENNHEARKNLGICYQMKGLLELAYYYFKEIEIDAKMKHILYDLGHSFYQMGTYEKAVDVWRWIINIDPNYLDVSEKYAIAEIAEKNMK